MSRNYRVRFSPPNGGDEEENNAATQPQQPPISGGDEDPAATAYSPWSNYSRYADGNSPHTTRRGYTHFGVNDSVSDSVNDGEIIIEQDDENGGYASDMERVAVPIGQRNEDTGAIEGAERKGAPSKHPQILSDRTKSQDGSPSVSVVRRSERELNQWQLKLHTSSGIPRDVTLTFYRIKRTHGQDQRGRGGRKPSSVAPVVPLSPRSMCYNKDGRVIEQKLLWRISEKGETIAQFDVDDVCSVSTVKPKTN